MSSRTPIAGTIVQNAKAGKALRIPPLLPPSVHPPDGEDEAGEVTHPKPRSKLGAALGLEPAPAASQLTVRATSPHPLRFLLFGQALQAATVFRYSRGTAEKSLFLSEGRPVI